MKVMVLALPISRGFADDHFEWPTKAPVHRPVEPSTFQCQQVALSALAILDGPISRAPKLWECWTACPCQILRIQPSAFAHDSDLEIRDARAGSHQPQETLRHWARASMHRSIARRPPYRCRHLANPTTNSIAPRKRKVRRGPAPITIFSNCHLKKYDSEFASSRWSPTPCP